MARTDGRVAGTIEELAAGAETLGPLPQPWVEAEDVANAVLLLTSEQSRYVTGVAIPVNLGETTQPASVPPLGIVRFVAAAEGA